ncbi:MAG: hypothetical protein EOP84_05630 [Verrucomicrobiaceae bacterium]|nr:MAG: hypothetical protein EOP84_05630 [Verrucomicrobiaceae bacterium]
MNEAVDEPQRSILAPLLESGPLQLFLALLLVAIGIFHLTLSLRILLRRRPPVSAGIHAVLLFSGPCIILLLVMAILPTTLPGYFIVGIDEEEPLRRGLQQASWFGLIGLGGFVLNLLFAIPCLFRSERIT